jgi:hypothetical protein
MWLSDDISKLAYRTIGPGFDSPPGTPGQKQCCGCGSEGSVINWPPGSGSLPFSKILKFQKKVQRFVIITAMIYANSLTIYFVNDYKNVQVGSGSGFGRIRN